MDDPEAFLAADLELHQIITAAAHNQIMARFMDSLTRLGMASRRRTATLPGVRTRSLQDHQAIVEALVRRDPEAAANIMRQHLESQSSLHESVASGAARSHRGDHLKEDHMSQITTWDEFPAYRYVPGVLRQAVCGEKVMMTRITYQGQVTIPLHKHEAEQIMLVVQGRLWATVGDEEQEIGRARC